MTKALRALQTASLTYNHEAINVKLQVGIYTCYMGPEIVRDRVEGIRDVKIHKPFRLIARPSIHLSPCRPTTA